MTHTAVISPLTCAVCVDPSGDDTLQRRAITLAEQLALPRAGASADHEVLLAVTRSGLQLRWLEPAGRPRRRDRRLSRGRPIYTDLTRIDATSGHGRSLRQPIARAVGITKGDPYRPTVIDATVGFGEDAWLLASLGCRVTAIERHPIVAAMLTDALCHAATRAPDIAERITLITADSRDVLATLDAADVIYLDPMFPPRRGSGLEPKRMRLLRRLVGDDTDAPALFNAARRVAAWRVVVKRPLHAAALGDAAPTVTHKGKSMRYDAYSTRIGPV